ncbi:MAG: DUF4293 domain-containing protein [Weeksellaceae bacterium]|jgi:hypothetical protein|nr:DUF4293 domain-containing protein [Weeksellaceae bacterium]MDX9705176.1 DUF4293 domain-containing protein [Weeksellaceae bacterium]
MIQRKQSIYLFLATLLSVLAIFFGNLWTINSEWIQPKKNGIIGLWYFVLTVLPFVTLFLYKNRKLQIQLTNLGIILNILLVGYLAYALSNLPGGFSDSEKGVGLFIPFGSIVLLLLANRLIKKDEKLVKSVDRFR